MNRLHRDVAGPCLAPRGSAVCIGAFDGVHRGHQEVLSHVIARAAQRDLLPVAISFDPIPRDYFARTNGVAQLSSVREKIAALFAAGIHTTLLLRFNAELAAMAAEDFVREVLVKRLRVREIWVGSGFRFGHQRAGDVEMLRDFGGRREFDVEVAPTIEDDGDRISSSRIRALLAAGDFDASARMLGRRFTIGGHVVYGRQLGRKLGYPTANLSLGRRLSPVAGVFAVRVHGVGADARPGVASLGVRPTVNGTEPLLEAHLFDFDGDLYGKRIQVEFVTKLREEQRFDNLDAMVRQIDCDAAQAREILGCLKPSTLNH
ncbi:MAG TPA: bifunctional riboflavin kinase/FAD synthetase [Rudaea sp.]|nr:bifunctional riboflavin kinase/FAD synthetase [Rudaea sp.]